MLENPISVLVFSLIGIFFLVKADGFKVGLIRFAYIFIFGYFYIRFGKSSGLVGVSSFIGFVSGYYFLDRLLKRNA